MEIEGKSQEEVEIMIDKLQVKKEKITTKNTQDIYEQYGIYLPEIKELKF